MPANPWKFGGPAVELSSQQQAGWLLFQEWFMIFAFVFSSVIADES